MPINTPKFYFLGQHLNKYWNLKAITDKTLFSSIYLNQTMDCYSWISDLIMNKKLSRATKRYTQIISNVLFSLLIDENSLTFISATELP